MKKHSLSLVMITKNAADTLAKSLESVGDLVNEIVIVDSYSTDKTVEISKAFGATIYFHPYKSEGEQRKIALSKAHGEWILILDSDETISSKLEEEIKEKLSNAKKHSGFIIPFQNHFLGRIVRYGGENYQKLRLFRRRSKDIYLREIVVHAELKGAKRAIGLLKNKINHYSYRSISQMYRKFTDYALREAKQKKQQGERTSLKKIVLYPVHMFWARFIEDKGYKDGFFRIPLDAGFAYMEFLTYFSMLFLKKKR